MDVARIGEFGLIERLAAIVSQGRTARPPSLLVGIGDDCAAWRIGDRVQLATTDTMVAGVHFLSSLPWRDVGWKAMAVNVSDIAAMGGTPSYALVTLCLPPHADAAHLDELYLGMNEACDAYGVTLAGGDIVRSDQITITVALMGEATTDDDGNPLLMTRDGAQAGDVVAVTGYVGDSAAGLRLLAEGRMGEDEDALRLLRVHTRPQPRLR
ncbi:MAG: thiamine-phosphate kinase, partial [Dehalococcoidia bacterium]